MPGVNWDAFEHLPGSPEYNFEMLCRALIRRHYARYGQFAALANQPGVEFHLKLRSACALGDSGRWYGWQCRWYDLPSGRTLGTVRRKKIQEAIATTEKQLPGLTDWVLWTRRSLTKGDQEWFYALKTEMRLDLWTAVDVEEHLSGEAEILRGTYFGELVLTPDSLKDLHRVAVAPIRPRWHPEVHQTIDAERELLKLLADPAAWVPLQTLASQLRKDTKALEADINDLSGEMADISAKIAALASFTSSFLEHVYDVLNHGDFDLLQQELEERPSIPDKRLLTLPGRLRATRKQAALTATNALADIRRADWALQDLYACLNEQLTAVVADAGCGKTQLSAQLTAADDDRPAGILLHGKDLHAGHNLDDLAHHIVIHGNQVSSLESLIAAVDAAGARARRRLPIIIDGLNEAEDPRDWRGNLAALQPILRKYNYVLFICTVRVREFADEALPPDVKRIYIPGFGEDAVKAIRRYFHYYRIIATDAQLPIGLLRNPLTLRLFCEVTNPSRARDVGIEAMPGSLTALFDRYLEQAAERIAYLAPRTHRYYHHDVRTALDLIGASLWEQNSRSLTERELRKRLGDDTRPWNESIIRALEQEGVILRNPGLHRTNQVTVVYDLLAGHLMGDAILAANGRTGFEEWIRDPSTISSLGGSLPDRHPLAIDLFRALVGLIPRRLHSAQLWQFLEDPLRSNALREAANLEGAFLDSKTVKELAVLAKRPPDWAGDLFERLRQTRGVPGHPLNSDFVDSILRGMGVADRDLRWSEWVRSKSDDLLADLERLEKRWRENADHAPTDRLRAQWVMWMLTSTVRKLRDQATRSLYWFGRGAPAALFDLALNALSINDPYVPERMLAAAYGVAMALHAYSDLVEFRESILPEYAHKLFYLMFDKGAPFSTTHALARDFSRHTIELAILHHPSLLSRSNASRIFPPFRDGGIRKWGRHNGFGFKPEIGFGGPLQMDFANYTLGRLVPGRGNYNFNNPQYKEVVANIHWRLEQLGYSPEFFEQVDNRMSGGLGSRSEGNKSRVDRYGKKYSWIAFFELYGFRYDKGLLKGKSQYSYDRDERPSDVDIDPSFPGEPHNTQVIRDDLLGNRKTSLKSWVQRSEPPDFIPYLVIDELNGVRGPWVLLNGFISQVDKHNSRSLFFSLRGFLLQKENVEKLDKLLTKKHFPTVDLTGIPEDYYTFAGEIPWCETYPENGSTELSLPAGYRIKKVPHSELHLERGGKELNEEETEIFLKKIHDLREEPEHEQALLNLLSMEEFSVRKNHKYTRLREPIFKKIPVVIPVRVNNWEGYHSGVNPGQHTVTPAREISEAFGLSLRVPSWDMYDEQGDLASISIHWGSSWGSGQILCYLRKDVLDKFLAKKNLELIWVCDGARESRYLDNDWPVEKQHFRKEFRQLHHYKREL